MFAIVLAGASALVWGSSDYCGGRASRGGNALGVTVMSQLFSLPLLAIAVFVLPGVLRASDFGWGAAAGAAGFLGLFFLYRGLATGAMAVVAPITAVTSAVIPMVVGLILERTPSNLALGGAVCALVAVALVSASGGRATVTPRVLTLALSSGAMFGVFFSLLAQVQEDSGVWGLVAARCTSIPFGLLLLARTGASLRIPGRLLGWVAAAGAGDVVANALFLFAVADGLLSVVAPVSSLYPVSTVLLALFVDKERVRPVQVAGLGLAAAALVLTAI